MRKTFLVLVVIACVAGTARDAQTYVMGSTNFTFTGYPDHSCHQPFIPYDRSQASIDMFNIDLETYKRCIKEYLEGAENDRKRILEKHNETVDQYNLFIRSIR